jgi:SAM-dependent methyltransferase
VTRRRAIVALLTSAAAAHLVAAVLVGGSALTAIRAWAGPHGRVAAAHEPSFPTPDRPVAPTVSPRWSTEDAREHRGEADKVIAALGNLTGKTVADVGAGEGYYEPHLSRAVGGTGRVIAEDIDAKTVAKLARRVRGLHNVTATLGRADNVGLARSSADVVLMVHMYHEITQPFALLWRVRASLRPGGRIAVVDADRPTANHGTPPALLQCELAAMGFAREATQVIDDGIYLAVFVPRATPTTIVPCR